MTKTEWEEQRRQVGDAVREASGGVHAARKALVDASGVLERARALLLKSRQRGLQGHWQNSML